MRRLRLLFILLLVSTTAYILMPFINGLGCNFVFQEMGEHVKQVGKCKSGVLTAFYQSSESGKSSYNRYLYGVLGDAFYLIRINKERVEHKREGGSQVMLGEDGAHAFGLYDGDRLYISRFLCVNDKKCFVITDDSIDNVYEMYFEGRLAFF